MKKMYGMVAVLFIGFYQVLAQSAVPPFLSPDPVVLRAQGSVKSIRKHSNDSTFVTGKFEYQHGDNWITVPTAAKVRGNFRLRTCYFPPLKLKFKKKDVASTIFAGNHSLKMVFPCLKSGDKNTLIRKEYLCYKFYEVLSPYYFRTCLAQMSLTEVSRKKPDNYHLLAFFVEDNSMVAKRCNGKILESRRLSPGAFDARQAIRNDFAQYMIGNADWSAVYQHNSNVLFAEGKYITLAYDFDMSGFVNAGYARENPPNLGTGNPRDRVYRGFCKTPAEMQEIRKEFLDKEPVILDIINAQASSFDERDMKDMREYIGEFYDILRSDDRFETAILRGCRTQ